MRREKIILIINNNSEILENMIDPFFINWEKQINTREFLYYENILKPLNDFYENQKLK